MTPLATLGFLVMIGPLALGQTGSTPVLDRSIPHPSVEAVPAQLPVRGASFGHSMAFGNLDGILGDELVVAAAFEDVAVGTVVYEKMGAAYVYGGLQLTKYSQPFFPILPNPAD